MKRYKDLGVGARVFIVFLSCYLLLKIYLALGTYLLFREVYEFLWSTFMTIHLVFTPLAIISIIFYGLSVYFLFIEKYYSWWAAIVPPLFSLFSPLPAGNNPSLYEGLFLSAYQQLPALSGGYILSIFLHSLTSLAIIGLALSHILSRSQKNKTLPPESSLAIVFCALVSVELSGLIVPVIFGGLIIKDLFIGLTILSIFWILEYYLGFSNTKKSG